MADTQGLLLKLDTSTAVAQQQNLRRTTEESFVALGKQGEAAKQLETRMVELGRATQSYTQSNRTGLFLPQGFAEAPEKISKVVRSTREIKKATDEAGGGLAGLGRSATTTTGLLSRLLAASGQSGAARGIGLLGAGVKSLAVSLNPVGIAVGLAASAIISLGANMLSAQTATEKFQSKARELQADFTNLTGATAVLGEQLDAIGAANQKGSFFQGAEKEGERLSALLATLSKAQTAIAEQGQRTLQPLELDIERIKQLGEALQKGPQFFRNLERAATAGPQQAQALKVLEQEIGLRVKNGALLVSAEQAQKLLGEAYQQTQYAIDENTKSIQRNQEFKTERSLGDVKRGLLDEIELQKLGNKERATELALRVAQKDSIGPLTAAQQKERDAALEIARAVDAEVEAEAKATEQARVDAAESERRRQAIEQEQKAREALVATFNEAVQSAQRETALLTLDGEAREKLRLELDLTAKATAAKIPLDEAQQRIISDTAQRLADATRAEKERREAVQASARATEESLRIDRQRAEELQRINDNTAEFLAVNAEDLRQKQLLADINERLNRLGAERGTQAGDEITAALTRNSEAKKYYERLKEIKDIGADIGADVGGAFAQAAFAAGNFGKNLQEAGKQLLQLAAQRAIIDALRALGSAAAGALFGGTPPSGAPVQRMLGGSFPGPGYPTFAMNGTILDRFQTITRGNQSVNVAEGGPSTPEVVVPLQRDQYGRLGIGQAGVPNTYNLSLPNVRSAQEARQIRPTLKQTLEQVERSSGRWRDGLRGGK